jgi:hypothetical protein
VSQTQVSQTNYIHAQRGEKRGVQQEWQTEKPGHPRKIITFVFRVKG